MNTLVFLPRPAIATWNHWLLVCSLKIKPWLQTGQVQFQACWSHCCLLNEPAVCLMCYDVISKYKITKIKTPKIIISSWQVKTHNCSTACHSLLQHCTATVTTTGTEWHSVMPVTDTAVTVVLRVIHCYNTVQPLSQPLAPSDTQSCQSLTLQWQ